MFLEGGRAILGWGSDHSSAFTLVKNVISRGLTGPFFTEFSPFTDSTDKKHPFLNSQLVLCVHNGYQF